MKKLFFYSIAVLSVIACNKATVMPNPTMSIVGKSTRLIPSDTSVQIIFTTEVSVVATGGRIFFADSSVGKIFLQAVCSTPGVIPVYNFEIKPLSGLDLYSDGVWGIQKDVIATFEILVYVIAQLPGDYSITTDTFPYSGNGNDGQYESGIVSKFESYRVPV